MKLKFVSPFLMWLIVGLGCAGVVLFVPQRVLFHRDPITLTVFALTILNWMYFFLGAVKVNRSAARSAAGVRRLVTEGVYAKVRHPIYSADIFLAWGVLHCFPNLHILACMIWMTIVLLCWMRVEEKAMIERFCDEYLDYLRRTPMVIPNFRG